MTSQKKTRAGAWTPGPYSLSEAYYEGSGVYTVSDANALAIAEVRSFNPKEDAQLFAAAPELYEALRDLLDASERHIFSTECQVERDRARAALLKTQGEEA